MHWKTHVIIIICLLLRVSTYCFPSVGVIICSLAQLFIIARAERDGTRAETRFRLSPKRTSLFKSVGASVQSTAGSRGVPISLSNAGSRSEVAWEYWLPTPFASFPFTSPPVRHRVPPGSERALLQCTGMILEIIRIVLLFAYLLTDVWSLSW